MGKYVNKLHLLGVFLGLTGLVLVCLGGGLAEHLTFSKRELIGDAIALGGLILSSSLTNQLGAIAAAIYISIGAQIRSKLPAFVYFVPSATISTILFTICTVTMEHTKPSEFFDWVETEYLLPVLWIALVASVLGISIIAVVMKFLPALVISIVLLFEPIAGTIS